LWIASLQTFHPISVTDIGWNVWSDGDPQVYIKDIGWNVWSDGDPQVYIKEI
jgi:hypothetical protein